MGNHRQVTTLISNGDGFGTVPSTTITPPRQVERSAELQEIVDQYASIWALDPAQYRPEDAPIPETWSETTLDWVSGGISHTTFYQDPDGRYWLVKNRDFTLWKEVASAQALDVMGLPHVPVTFTQSDYADQVVQPLVANVRDLVGRPHKVAQSTMGQTVSVMHLAAQWLLVHPDGHEANILRKVDPTLKQHHTVVPIDYGLAWEHMKWMPFDPQQVTSRGTAYEWLQGSLRHSNILLKNAEAGQFRSLTDAQWDDLYAWADSVATSDDSVWTPARATVMRGGWQTYDPWNPRTPTPRRSQYTVD